MLQSTDEDVAGNRLRCTFGAPSQFCVGAVAKGLGLCLFAAAEKALAGLIRRPEDWHDICRLMRAIAERLLIGLAAGAPIIGFPRFDIDWIRRFLGNLACSHFASPKPQWTSARQ
jgi:hypothetical protein